VGVCGGVFACVYASVLVCACVCVCMRVCVYHQLRVACCLLRLHSRATRFQYLQTGLE